MLTNAMLEVIAERRSIRDYQEVPLTLDQKQALVQAALISPSSMNQQEWHLSVVENKKILGEMEQEIFSILHSNHPEMAARIAERGGNVFYHAPVVFSIATKAGDSQLVNVGIMAQSIMLAATSMGLGSVCLGLPRVLLTGEHADKWKHKLHYPAGYEFGIMVAVGVPNMDGNPREIDQSKVSYIE